MPHSLVVIDDHELAHSALRLLVSSREDLTIAACFRQASSGLAYLKENPTDIIILDLELPDMDGVTALQQIVDLGLGSVLILSGITKPAVLNRCRSIGAMGIVSKGDPAQETLSAIDALLSGQEYHSPKVIDWLKGFKRRETPIDLSGRQWEILWLIAQGFSNKEIAYRLAISAPTVSFHVGELARKIGADHPRQIVELAKAEGLL